MNTNQRSLLSSILLTFLIVTVIYTSVVWANFDLLPEQRINWDDYLAYLNEGEKTSLLTATPVLAVNAKKVSNITKPHENTPQVKALWVHGVTSRITLTDTATTAQQVKNLWEEFTNSQQLHDSVSWLNESNTIYAYYHDFDDAYTQAQLLIGYQTKADNVNAVPIKTGKVKRYSFTSSGNVPDKVWEDAYSNGVILEQYKIKIDGSWAGIDIQVIK